MLSFLAQVVVVGALATLAAVFSSSPPPTSPIPLVPSGSIEIVPVQTINLLNPEPISNVSTSVNSQLPPPTEIDTAQSASTVDTSTLSTSQTSIVEITQPIEQIETDTTAAQEEILHTFDTAVIQSLSATTPTDTTTSTTVVITPTASEVQEPNTTELSTQSGETTHEPNTAEQRILEVKQQLIDDVEETFAASANTDTQITDVNAKVNTALSQVERIVREERGVRVDTSKVRQAVAAQIAALSKKVNEERQKLVERGGLAIYQDSDNDGISDYDEVNIYKTDPTKAKTVAGSLTDGQKIQLGINPTDPKGGQIKYENPWSQNQVVLTKYRVTSINVSTSAPAPATTTEFTSLAKKEEVRVEGKALPNSFVTLYIYSTPIVVTIKTDDNGDWQYALNQELPDGGHSMYVATTDNSGKILARSSRVLFTKQAAAVSFNSPANPQTPSVGFFEKNLIFLALFLSGMALSAGLILVGFMRPKPVLVPPIDA